MSAALFVAACFAAGAWYLKYSDRAAHEEWEPYHQWSKKGNRINAE